MLKRIMFALVVFFVCMIILIWLFANKKNEYVPCQEMPDLIQQYNADFRALSRFYSPASTAARGGAVAE